MACSPSSEAIDEDSQYLSGNNDEDTVATADGGDEFEQIRKRLDDQQRQIFASCAANGLFLGGGYIAKKTKDKYRKKSKSKPVSNNPSSVLPQAGNELETVLGTQSASILPLAEANPPVLRRRKASAGQRRPRRQHHQLQSGKE